MKKIQSNIPIEKLPKQTIIHKEIAYEFLVMLQNYSKEEHYERTYQDLEAVMEPSQADKLFDKVKKAGPIDIQKDTMAEGNLHEEEIIKEQTSQRQQSLYIIEKRMMKQIARPQTQKLFS